MFSESLMKENIFKITKEIKELCEGEKVVVAFSGGLDSTVVSALALQALGRERVEAININFEEYSYRKSLQNIEYISKYLNLKLKVIPGKKLQEEVLKRGPACNKCTRIAKLGRIKKESSGRLVLTGSNQSDTWGKKGLKLSNGFYAPLFNLNKEEIKKIADYLELKILRIGESEGREGCKLKHLLKPLAVPGYHGLAVAEANEVLLDWLAKEHYPAQLANVKIIGPLKKNIALVNLLPLPGSGLKEKITKSLEKLERLEEVRFLDQPIRLIIKANKGQFDNHHSRYWLEKGRLQPDFSIPLEIDWLLTTNKNLSTFQVIDYQIAS